MTRGKPVLDPKRDLKGAVPETLANTLVGLHTDMKACGQWSPCPGPLVP